MGSVNKENWIEERKKEQQEAKERETREGKK